MKICIMNMNKGELELLLKLLEDAQAILQDAEGISKLIKELEKK